MSPLRGHYALTCGFGCWLATDGNCRLTGGIHALTRSFGYCRGHWRENSIAILPMVTASEKCVQQYLSPEHGVFESSYGLF